MEPSTTEGVEHRRVLVKFRHDPGVMEPSTPEGVEHYERASRRQSIDSVMEPSTPEGVEHATYYLTIPEDRLGDGTFDAGRR